MKKFLSFLFTFIMIFSFATVSASASGIEAQDMDCYAADGVSVSVTDATEPVDISACVASDVGSTVPPVYSDAPNYNIDYVADGVSVSVTDATEPVDVSNCFISDSGQVIAPMARATTFDLANGSVSIDWDLPAESTLYTSEFFKTNTQNIKVHLKGDISVSLTVKLYNSDGNLIGSVTSDVGTFFGTNYDFSQLTASETYYIQITNNGQRDVNITGTVSQ